MVNKILILTFAFLLFIPFSFAEIKFPDGFLFFDSFENETIGWNTTLWIPDGTGDSFEINTTPATIIHGSQSLSFGQGNGRFLKTVNTSIGSNVTCSGYFYMDANFGATTGTVGIEVNSTNPFQLIWSPVINNNFQTGNFLSLTDSGIGVAFDTLQELSIYADGIGGLNYFINGTLIATEIGGATLNNSDIRVGDSSDATTDSQQMDLIICWKGNYSEKPEIPSILDITSPNITINSPANNSAVNTFPITTVDLTVTDASSVNCTLRNESDIFNTSFGSSGNFLLNFTTEEIEQNFNLNITCTDTSNNSKTELLSLTVDTILPLITINQPLNNSLHKNIPLDITCFDDFVFILNVTLFNSTGSLVEVQNDTNVSDSNNGILSLINQEIDTSGFADAAYTLNATCSDSHTKKEIEDYIIFPIGAAGFQYLTAEGNDVQITLIGSPLDTPVTTKNIDRYNIDFGVTAVKESHTFKVTTAQNKIQILDTGTKGHLLVSNGHTGNWIDFENGDETSTVVVERITDKQVNVHVFSNNFNFRSIGGLNINSEFHTINTDNTAPSPSILVSNSTPEASDIIQINVTCTDTNGIQLIEVANNISAFANVTSFDFANETPATASYNHSVDIAGTVINEFTCTDAVGNSAQANFIYNSTAKGTVQNTLETFNYSAFLSFMAIAIVIVLLVAGMVKRKGK